MKKLMIALALLAMASIAGANTFSSDGTVFEPTHGYTFNQDRYLINDGSFEAGCDVHWSCATNNTSTWIQDLVPLGLWNYDGVMTAWLGGFSGGFATCWTEICQPITIDGCILCWYWMGYVNDQVGLNYVSIDGVPVYEYVLQLSDHLLDYQQHCIDISAYADGEIHDVCVAVDNEANCGANLGDNWFVDYLEIETTTATEDMSLSTVKALY